MVVMGRLETAIRKLKDRNARLERKCAEQAAELVQLRGQLKELGWPDLAGSRG